MTPTPPALLRKSFAELRANGLRARDTAHRLGISEGCALAAHAVSLMSPQEATDSALAASPLDADWIAILQGLETVGPVMALTRNEHVVHEKIGVYRNVSAQGPMGLAVGVDIDLRLFLNRWHTGFHVVERTERGEQHSLQFFDAYGQAVHKVFARPQTDLAALQWLADRHANPYHALDFRSGASPLPVDRPDAEIDVEGFATAWDAMQDTHEFFDLLKRFQVGRLQALHLMAGRHTRRAPLLAAEWLLHEASRTQLPIMVFVGNAGCIQIHTGPVQRIEPMGPWINVLDPGFNLHLRTDAIHECWLVTKPTADGDVTSIELFDADGQVIAMFFGERKPGKPELLPWRQLAHELADRPQRAQEAA